MANKIYPENFIKFFGTAGARMVMSKQLRSSGGIWIRLGSTNMLIDPGPGTLVRCWGSEPSLDPSLLDAIILTHRHLDHSGDMNVMVEAMVEGGYHPHGRVFAPADALDGPEPILFQYLRKYPEEITTLCPGVKFPLGDVSLEAPLRHWHPVETYGIKLSYRDQNIAYISDTRYFPQLVDAYQGMDVLIVSMTFVQPFHSSHAYHLSSEEVVPLISGIKPRVVLLTHFGRKVIEEGPESIARRLEHETGVAVCAASDGMVFELDLRSNIDHAKGVCDAG